MEVLRPLRHPRLPIVLVLLRHGAQPRPDSAVPPPVAQQLAGPGRVVLVVGVRSSGSSGYWRSQLTATFITAPNSEGGI